jgi:hypothetical protein
MREPTKEEVYEAIAGPIQDTRHSNETFAVIAERLGISLSSVRRAASAHGIIRRPRLGQAVLDKIERDRQQEGAL